MQHTRAPTASAWRRYAAADDTTRMAVPSLSNSSNGGSSSTSTSFEERDDITNTELYTNFKEAFNITLRNNPGILPGSSSIIDSLQKTLFKVQKRRVQKERELRSQLDKVKSEKDKVENQLRKEMGTTALTLEELTNELDTARSKRDTLRLSVERELANIQAVKDQLKIKMSDVTKEKGELSKHLKYISQSRIDLEKTLEIELELVEKDRVALKKVATQRTKLQQQKRDNKELEDEIEALSAVAAKEQEALQLQKATLKERIDQLKKENEDTRQSLEQEEKQLKDIATVMQAKKTTLIESKANIENQYQKEILDLRSQMQRSTIIHEDEMEQVVKSKIKEWKDTSGSVLQYSKPSIKSRLESKLKKVLPDDDSVGEYRYNNKEAKMQNKTQLEQAKTAREGASDRARQSLQTPRTPREHIYHRASTSPVPDRDREVEIQYLRDELSKLRTSSNVGHPTQNTRYRSPDRFRSLDISDRSGRSRHSGSRCPIDRDRYDITPIDRGQFASPMPRIKPLTSRHSDRRVSYSRFDEERDDTGLSRYPQDSRREGGHRYRDRYY